MSEPITPELVEQVLHSPDSDARRDLARRLAEPGADVQVLLRLLGDRDWRVRKTSVDSVVSRGDETAIAGLVDCLGDEENAGRRNSATEALIRIGIRALPALVGRLREAEDVDVRLAIVNLLGEIRSDEGFDELVQLVSREGDTNVLSSVVSSLGRYRRAESVGPLLGLLAREDPWLRYHVVEALGEVGEPEALPAIVGLWGEESLRKPILDAVGSVADVGTIGFLLSVAVEGNRPNLNALRALVRVYDADKPRLIRERERQVIRRKFAEEFPSSKLGILVDQARATPKREVREFLIRILGWSRDPDVLPHLVRFLESPDTVDAASEALVSFGPESIPELVRLFHSDEEDVVLSAIRVATQLSDRSLLSPLTELLEHESSMVRRSAIDALGQIRDLIACDYLLTSLDDSDPGVQTSAVDALSSILGVIEPERAETVVGHLRRLLKSSSRSVRLGALSVYTNVRAEGATEELLAASKDSDHLIRRRAVALMGRYRDERFGDALIHALADEDTPVRLAAIDALDRVRPPEGLRSLLFALEDEDLWIRSAGARVIGSYGAKEAIPSLLKHLARDLPPMKIACLEGLGAIADPATAEEVGKWLADPDIEVAKGAVMALARIPGDAVFRRLLESLDSSDWRMRAAAASALATRGERRALPPLHRMLLEDPDDFVKSTVVSALDAFADRGSFPYLLAALSSRPILDDVCELLARHGEIYGDLLEDEWKRADRRREPVIAAILQESTRRRRGA
jgi:HEAT repeat protein